MHYQVNYPQTKDLWDFLLILVKIDNDDIAFQSVNIADAILNKLRKQNE